MHVMYGITHDLTTAILRKRHQYGSDQAGRGTPRGMTCMTCMSVL